MKAAFIACPFTPFLHWPCRISFSNWSCISTALHLRYFRINYFYGMPNTFFRFKQFTIHHDRCAMKVTTDACLFGAWVAAEVQKLTIAPVHFLDIGAGTGLLSLMVAQKNKGLIDAVEIDAAAAGQASENIAPSPWEARIRLTHQDVLLWNAPTRYDCIFSNPPFYEKEIKSFASARNVAHHDEGLKLAELLSYINKHLAEEGVFFLLLPAKREKETERILQACGLFVQQKIRVAQTPKHAPFRIMIQGCRKKANPVATHTLVIKDESGAYTQAFVSLLHDYYLYLSIAS